MKTTHEFGTSCTVENRWAPMLDKWLAESYSIRPASMDEQWKGIDRVAIDEDGMPVGIDYKCDEQARRTGRIFIETVSNDVSGRKGWAWTSEAKWIFYLVTPDCVLAFLMSRLRKELPGWLRRFGERAAQNRGYRTLGVCVPLAVAQEAAEYVARLDLGDGVVLQERDSEEDPEPPAGGLAMQARLFAEGEQ